VADDSSLVNIIRKRVSRRRFMAASAISAVGFALSGALFPNIALADCTNSGWWWPASPWDPTYCPNGCYTCVPINCGCDSSRHEAWCIVRCYCVCGPGGGQFKDTFEWTGIPC